MKKQALYVGDVNKTNSDLILWHLGREHPRPNDPQFLPSDKQSEEYAAVGRQNTQKTTCLLRCKLQLYDLAVLGCCYLYTAVGIYTLQLGF